MCAFFYDNELEKYLFQDIRISSLSLLSHPTHDNYNAFPTIFMSTIRLIIHIIPNGINEERYDVVETKCPLLFLYPRQVKNVTKKVLINELGLGNWTRPQS